jgi:hypothetical protein
LSSHMGNTWHAAYNRRYERERRAECLRRLGGKCVRCGSSDDLEGARKRAAKLMRIEQRLDKPEAAGSNPAAATN